MHQYTGTAARERLLEISNFPEAQLGPERIETVSRIPLDFLEPTLPLIIRERVYLHTSYGDEIPVIMCYPEDAGGKTQYPVIMCLPGGVGNVKEDLIDSIPVLPFLARQGYVTVALDRLYQGERYVRTGNLFELLDQKTLDRTFATDIFGRTMYDLEVVFEYTQGLDKVASSRVGIMRGSQGGYESYVFSALERRVAATACISGTVSWEVFFQTEAWKNLIPPGSGAHKKVIDAGDNWFERLATYEEFAEPWLIEAKSWKPLIAPRALLIALGREDTLCPVAAGMSAYEACRGIYRTYGASERLKLRIEPRGHNMTKDTLTAIRDFFGESMS